MSRRVGVHRPDHAQVVRMLGQMRIEAADRQPALPVVREREDALTEVPHRAPVGAQSQLRRVTLPVPLVEFRLGIKRVDLTRPAVHEQEHDMLGLRRKVRRPRRQFTRERLLPRHQVEQRQPREAARSVPQEIPP